MTGTATRKRPASQSRKKSPAREREQAAKQPTSEPTSNGARPAPAEDRTTTLTSAYQAALNDRGDDGTVPAARLEAVRNAYLTIPKRERGRVSADLNADAMANMTSADGTVDTGLVHAIATLSGLFKEHYDASAVIPHDPRPGIAGLLAALDEARESLLANLTDDDRSAIETIVVANDDQALATYDAARAPLAKLKDRVINGRTRKRTGYSGPQRDLGALVRKALEEADGNRLSFADVCRTCDISNGALIKRWRKDNIPGVKAVGDDTGGQRAFELA